MRYIIELEPGKWLAKDRISKWVTKNKKQAMVFNTRDLADHFKRRLYCSCFWPMQISYGMNRRYPHARIVEVEPDCPHDFPEGEPGETVLCSKCGTPWEVEG